MNTDHADRSMEKEIEKKQPVRNKQRNENEKEAQRETEEARIERQGKHCSKTHKNTCRT